MCPFGRHNFNDSFTSSRNPSRNRRYADITVDVFQRIVGNINGRLDMILGYILIYAAVIYVAIGITYAILLWTDEAENLINSIFLGIIWLPFVTYVFYKLRTKS